MRQKGKVAKPTSAWPMRLVLLFLYCWAQYATLVSCRCMF